jgi:L-ribulose-5-phosphate 4-epimerase
MLLKEIREEIVELGIRMLEEKLVHDMQGNMSFYERGSGLIAVTPSAIPYKLRKAHDICVVDLQGNLIEGSRRPTSEIALHSVLYKSRADISAIVHPHPVHASVFAVIAEPIPQVLTEVTMGFKGDVPVAGYGRPGTLEVAKLTASAMAPNKRACLMANHGLVTAAENLGMAFHITLAVEDAANIVIMARSMKAKISRFQD